MSPFEFEPEYPGNKVNFKTMSIAIDNVTMLIQKL